MKARSADQIYLSVINYAGRISKISALKFHTLTAGYMDFNQFTHSQKEGTIPSKVFHYIQLMDHAQAHGLEFSTEFIAVPVKLDSFNSHLLANQKTTAFVACDPTASMLLLGYPYKQDVDKV